jgi:hypothetical protein
MIRRLLTFLLIAIVSCGCGGPQADMDQFEARFKKQTNFSTFTNEAWQILTLQDSQQKQARAKALEAVLPKLTVGPPSVGIIEKGNGLRVTYFDGLVCYQIHVLRPGETLPIVMSGSARAKLIAENVHLIRMNN